MPNLAGLFARFLRGFDWFSRLDGLRKWGMPTMWSSMSKHKKQANKKHATAYLHNNKIKT